MASPAARDTSCKVLHHHNKHEFEENNDDDDDDDDADDDYDEDNVNDDDGDAGSKKRGTRATISSNRRTERTICSKSPQVLIGRQ